MALPTQILGDEFIVGARLSGHSIIKREWDGCWRSADPIEVLKAQGFEWACISVRTESSAYLRSTDPSLWWSLPWRDEYWESIEITEQLLLEAQEAGLKLWLYLELSDRPAHSANQHAPSDWQGLSVEETADRLEAYVYETVRYYSDRGIDIDMYSLSGEIEWGILDFAPEFQQGGGRIPIRDVPHMTLLKEDVWPIEALLLKAGASTIRRADPDALILLYVANEPFLPSLIGLEDMATAFFEEMVAHEVDFDVAGFSWPYPYTTGAWPFPQVTVEWLFRKADEISQAISRLGKPVIIAEAGYPSSSRGVPEQAMSGYPFTLDGQAAWMMTMLEYAYSNQNIQGFIYFYPEWLPRPYYRTDQDFQLDGNSLFFGNETTKPALAELARFVQEHEK
jgi:arabinogalactan endo-1,4-beta-galactosidase